GDDECAADVERAGGWRREGHPRPEARRSLVSVFLCAAIGVGRPGARTRRQTRSISSESLTTRATRWWSPEARRSLVSVFLRAAIGVGRPGARTRNNAEHLLRVADDTRHEMVERPGG